MFRAIELGDKYLKHLITSDTKNKNVKRDKKCHKNAFKKICLSISEKIKLSISPYFVSATTVQNYNTISIWQH